MTAEEADRITAERLARWRERLKAEMATPMVLVSVAHGKNAGGVIVTIPEDVATADCAALAGKAAAGLAHLARAELASRNKGGGDGGGG